DLKAVIIDDDDAMRSLLKEIFEQMNITAEAFRSYDDFKNIERSRNIDFNLDFILTDIQMPKTDGFSVLKNLKNSEITSYKNQPVIAMTGSREHNRDFYFENGFAEMLPKPFSKHELVVALERIFPKGIHSVNAKNTETTIQEFTSNNHKFD